MRQGPPGLEVQPPRASGGASVASELWALPAVADPRDDEFESVTLPAAYTRYTTGGIALGSFSKAVLSYSPPAAAVTRYQAHTDRRPSWLSLQNEIGGGGVIIAKPVVLASTDLVWTRVVFPINTSTGGGTGLLRLVLMAATGGHPDPSNMVLFGNVQNSDLSYNIKATSIIAGVTRNIPGSESDTLVGGIAEFLAIEKVGTKYRFYCPANGNRRLWTDSNAIAITIAYAGWWIEWQNSYPDCQVFEADFLRFNANGFLRMAM